VGIVIDMRVVSNFVSVSVWANVRALIPSLAASAIMAATLQFLLNSASGQPGIPALIVLVVAGAAEYAGLLWLLDSEAVMALFALARTFIPGRSLPAVSQPD
jgi:hypothetical protein